MCKDCKEQNPELSAQLGQAYESLMELKRRAARKSTTLTNEAIDFAVQRYNAAMRTIKETHERRKENYG